MRKLLLPGLLVLICLAGCSAPKQVAKHKSIKPAADFTLKDGTGATVKLSDYRGKVVLLNFWATWCGPCGVEIPWFVTFEQRYKAQGFAVLGVSMDDDGWNAIKPFVAEHKINYRVLLGSDTVAQLYGGVDSLPTSFVIDKEGNLAYPPHIGLISKDEYTHEIETLLGWQGEQQTRSSRPVGATLLFARPTK